MLEQTQWCGSTGALFILLPTEFLLPFTLLLFQPGSPEEWISNIYDGATPSIAPSLSVSFPWCIKWHWSYRCYLCSRLSAHLSFHPSSCCRSDGSLRVLWTPLATKVVWEPRKNRKWPPCLSVQTCHWAELHLFKDLTGRAEESGSFRAQISEVSRNSVLCRWNAVNRKLLHHVTLW